MIEKKFTIDKEEKKVYLPLPEDVYTVQLLDITSKENATYDTRSFDDAHKVFETVLSFQFTVLDTRSIKGETVRGHNIWVNFVPTVLYIGKNGKNVLYKIVEALLGHELSPEEEAKLDSDKLNELIGGQCRIATEHTKKGDKVYENVAKYLVAQVRELELSDEEIEVARVKEKKEEVTASNVEDDMEMSND